AARFGKERGRLDVGRQKLAVPVDDIGTRGGDPAGRPAAHIRLLQAEIDEPSADRRVDREEYGDRHDDAVLLLAAGRLARTVDDDGAFGRGILATPARQPLHWTIPPVTIISVPVPPPSA